MPAYMKAEQRRTLARAAALDILSRGEVAPERLALRHVAQEMDVSLSTLTYVYPSIGALFEDLVEEHSRALWEGLIDGVGDRGLAIELEQTARRYFLDVLRDPGRTALLLWQIRAIAGRSWARAQIDSRRAERLVATIAERGGEHYRVGHDVLARMVLAFAYGQIITWVSGGAADTYWSTTLAGIDGTVLLADPRPVGVPHPRPALHDYASAVAPDQPPVPRATPGRPRDGA